MVSEIKQRFIYVIGDLLSTALAWFIFNVIRFNNVVQEYQSYTSFTDYLAVRPVWLGQILFPLLMLGLYYLSGYYNKVFFKSRVEEFASTASTALIGTVVIYFVAIVDDPIPDRASNYELLMMLFLRLFSFVYVTRLSITLHVRSLVARGQLKFNSLIIGTGHSARKLRRKLAALRGPRAALYNVVGYVATSPEYASADLDLPVYTMDQLPEITRSLGIHNLIVNSHPEGMQQTLNTINALFPLDLPIYISPSLFQLLAAKPKLHDLEGEILIDITHANMSESTINLKRAGDIVVSSVALTLLLPVFGVIALMIKRDSKGPVFFSQERIGLRKKPFRIHKFRTMRTDAENQGPALSSANDSRITRIGRTLRKYRLDELPQFWNVLKGDMSLIGPRPEREYYIRQIIREAPYYTLVHQVRPGITSLGMVKYGYANTIPKMIERLQYDIVYLENISFTIDMKILMYTLSTVINGRGV